MPPGKTALVLSAGGAYGAIHVGMLKALVNARVRWDFIVGSSAGALNGAFIAGYKDIPKGVRELEAAWSNVKRRDIYPLHVPTLLRAALRKSPNLISERALRRWIQGHLKVDRLEDFPHEFHAVATEVLTGQEKVLSSGDALQALLASTSIPVIFPPVDFEGTWYTDGAVGQHAPITVARELGATRALVLTTGYACALKAPPGNVLTMALHAYNTVIQDHLILQIEALKGEMELIVPPPLCPQERDAADFDAAEEVIARSFQTTTRWLAEGGMTSGVLPRSLYPHHHS